jgi:hypothetical protein
MLAFSCPRQRTAGGRTLFDPSVRKLGDLRSLLLYLLGRLSLHLGPERNCFWGILHAGDEESHLGLGCFEAR